MRAIIIERKGSPVAPNVKLVHDIPQPTLGGSDVLVRTEASALNHLDLWVGSGLPGIDTVYPFISGSDGVGTITAVGAEVDKSWLGVRVLLNAAVEVTPRPLPGLAAPATEIEMIGEHRQGCHAEYFRAPVGNVIAVGNCDPIQAAAFGLTHLTAWRMLITRARMAPGQTVLIPGIGGGVALAALAIARHFACKTIVTSRHQWKLDRASKLGAEHAILDDGGDFSRLVRAATQKRGVDIVADSVGKAVHQSCLKSLARGGTFVTCGCTTGADATTDLARIFWGQLSVLGATMGGMGELSACASLFLRGFLPPVLDSVHKPADASEAWSRLESGNHFGKIVVDWCQ